MRAVERSEEFTERERDYPQALISKTLADYLVDFNELDVQ